MYKLAPLDASGKQSVVQRLSDTAFIPFDPTNADYQAFKYEINNDEAQLETADGVVLTSEEAKAYVATLP